MASFAILGEPLSLELANTVVGGEGGPEDLLRSREDVAAWISAVRDRLPPGAADRPPDPTALRNLRAAIRSLLAAAIDGGDPDPGALAHLNAISEAIPRRPRLEWGSGTPPAAVDAENVRHPEATLAAIARSAIALLGGEGRHRLRRCEGPGCVLMFLAANPRRRWCSAATCGNRVRVARHYARHAADRPRSD